MPDGTGIEPQSRLDSGEYYERVKRRWMPMVWFALTLMFISTPMYCVMDRPTKSELKTAVVEAKKSVQEGAPTKVEFARLEGRFEAWRRIQKQQRQQLNLRLARMEQSLDALVQHLIKRKEKQE